jgi:hypothetical protein
MNSEKNSGSSVVGTLIAAPIAAMAAIPIVMGAILFAPVYIPLALICAHQEDAEKRRKS